MKTKIRRSWIWGPYVCTVCGSWIAPWQKRMVKTTRIYKREYHTHLDCYMEDHL